MNAQRSDLRLRDDDRAWTGWALLAVRVALGGIFVFAASGKVVSPHAFAGSMGAFKILHESLLLEASLALLWQELICGTLLVLGIWTRASAALIAAMTALFFAAIASAMARGFDIDCGCFGAMLESGVGWTALGRTVVLMAMALAVLVKGPGRLSLTNS